MNGPAARFDGIRGSRSQTKGQMMLMRTWKTVVCSIAAGLCAAGASSVAKGDTIAYMGTASGEFGTIDLNNGVFTHIGITSLNGQAALALPGMGEANGVLYGATFFDGGLVTIDPA